ALVGGRRGLVVQGAVPVVALAVQVGLGQRVAGLVDPRLAHVQHAVAVAVAAGRTRHAGAGVGLDLVADTGPGQADVAGVLDRDRVVDDVAGAVRRAVRHRVHLGDGDGRVVDQSLPARRSADLALVGGRRGL